MFKPLSHTYIKSILYNKRIIYVHKVNNVNVDP